MKQRCLYHLIIPWLLTIPMCGLCILPDASAETVWQIGSFNFSSAEFNQRSAGPPLFGERFPKGPLVYVIGKSRAERDWPAFQPGSTVGQAGVETHPYTIEFELLDTPRGLYTLKVAMLVETPRAPNLQIDVNGHSALYYRHPQLNYAGGDRELVVSPIGSADTVSAEIPTAFLTKGANKLVLAAINDPVEAADVTHSGIIYDAIELEHDANGRFSTGNITAEIVPTIFYVRQGDGLNELVDVMVRSAQSLAHGRVTLKLGTRQFTRQLSSNRDFGEEKVEFAVPEFTAGTSAEVTMKIGGQTRRFTSMVSPGKKWTLFVVPHEHLDVGYTDYQAKVAEVQSRALDEAIDMIHRHPEFRYSPDGFWCFEQFMAARNPAQRKRLIELVKARKIFAPPQEASLVTGFPSLETLIRSLSSGYEFSRENGTPFDYANITDVPSYSWSYASILAGAGLKYFMAGSDNDNGPILVYSQLHEKSPFWWAGPDGGKILMWYARSYLQVAYMFGLPPYLPAGRDSLPIFLQAYSRPEYKSDATIVYGTQVENTDLFPEQAELAAQWNKQYAYPRMQFSGFAEAMDHIAGQMRDSMPVVRGDGGPYWEFGNASDAACVAMERSTEQRALSAEKFSTISTLLNPVIDADSTVLHRLWRNMVLVDEHTWTDNASVSDPGNAEANGQIAVKENFAKQAQMDTDYLLRRYLAAIAGSINDPAGTLVVFNSLSWKRSGLVQFDLRKGSALRDLTTREVVPYEVLSTDQNYLHIRFLAQKVPALGYKSYALVPARAEQPPAAAQSTDVLENRYYRVTLDAESGAVKSIFDKDLNQELVNPSAPYRFDQYLYVTGGDEWPNRLQEFSSATPMPKLAVHPAGEGKLVAVTREPYGTVARLESSGLNTPQIATDVVLFDDQKKIMLVDHVRKAAVNTKEGVYFSFPFKMEHPQFRYDLQNGFVDPARDQMPGAGKEWFSAQHWVRAQEGGASVAIVPIDAPLITFGDIVRGAWPKEFGERSGSIFSYVMNNYYFTNWPAAQGGDFTFRYVITSGADLRPEYLSQLGQSEMTPLDTDEIVSNDKEETLPAPLPAAEGSFLQIDQPNVTLVTWKTAEDGEGTIMRFVEVAGKETSVAVQVPQMPTESVWTCNLMEQKQALLPSSQHGFTFSIKPFQIVTIRIKGTPHPETAGVSAGY